MKYSTSMLGPAASHASICRLQPKLQSAHLVVRKGTRHRGHLRLRGAAAEQDAAGVPPPTPQPLCLTRVPSEYNSNVAILQFPESFEHREVAGARVLFLDHSGNVHSMYREGSELTGGLYWDYLAIIACLVPLDAGPLAVLGLGAGTVARAIAAAAPSVSMVGWELDPAVVEVSRVYLGLAPLEQEGRLVVRVGDALCAEAVGQDAPFCGAVVDLFAEGMLLPQLTEVDYWSQIRGMLAPGGRVVANVGYVGTNGAGEAAMAAIADAFDGELQLFVLSTPNTANLLALTGPAAEDLPSLLPEGLRPCGQGWVRYDPSAYPVPASWADRRETLKQQLEQRQQLQKQTQQQQEEGQSSPPSGNSGSSSGGFMFEDQDV